MSGGSAAPPRLGGVIEPGTGMLRIARGGVLAVACTLIAATGHVGGGGQLPHLTPLLVTGALLGGAFVVLADRQRSLLQVAPAAVGSQVLFHAAFATFGLGSPVPDLGMLTSHLGAAFVMAVLTTHGDGLLWALARLLRVPRLPELDLTPLPPAGPATPADLEPALERWVRHDARVHPRRGPPDC